MEKTLGRHVLVEVTKCTSPLLDNIAELEGLMVFACLKGGAGILGTVSKKFEPQGVTVLVGLSESHASIHTWPEHQAACLDVFTCGTVDPLGIVAIISEHLPGEFKVKLIERKI